MPDDFIKDFTAWNTLKQHLDALPRVPGFNAREIWWCSVGTNVGSEICGKGERFSRPVLILKRTSATTFIGVPLTSKLKERWDYHRILIKENPSDLQISDIRALDARRLLSKIEKLSESVFADVLAAVQKIFSLEP